MNNALRGDGLHAADRVRLDQQRVIAEIFNLAKVHRPAIPPPWMIISAFRSATD
jgi:hypothetical protein